MHLYYYMYSLDKIQTLFPRLNPDLPMDHLECGIPHGWAPEMKFFTGNIFRVRRFLEENDEIYLDVSALRKISTLFAFSERIGKILKVELSAIMPGYYYLDYHIQNDKYSVSMYPSKETIGTITNMPVEPQISPLGKILKRIKKENSNEKIFRG